MLGHKRAYVFDGDVPGHEFHGNQYTEGEGGGTQAGAGYAKPSEEELHRQFRISGRGTFSNYNEAAREGRKYARYLGREVGMEKANEYGKTVYNVKPIPKPENRYGHELRMEILKPTDPL
jgi:hypothetical protein